MLIPNRRTATRKLFVKLIVITSNYYCIQNQLFCKQVHVYSVCMECDVLWCVAELLYISVVMYFLLTVEYLHLTF